MSDRTILVVDPDTTSLKFLERKLQEQEYAVLGTTSGKEGLIFTWRDRPDLIIFDTTIRDIPPEEFVQKLRNDSRSAKIPMLVLSSDRDVSKKDDFLQIGCNAYLIKSGEAVTELPEVAARLMGTKQEIVRKGGYLIAFLSAKGGTGTSSLCANIATTICDNKPEVSMVVVDLVLPVGSIASIVGYQGDVNLFSIADMPPDETLGIHFHKLLPEVEPWGFQLLAGATDPNRANHLKATRISEIIKELQAGYDYVVIDLGRSLSRISLPIIQKADLLVLTVSTDQSTIALTKTIWEYLQTKHISAQNVYAILNRAVGLEGLTKTEAEEIIELPIKTAIPYLGGNFALANNLHQPLIKKYPNDTATIILKDTASGMINLAGKLRNR